MLVSTVSPFLQNPYQKHQYVGSRLQDASLVFCPYNVVSLSFIGGIGVLLCNQSDIKSVNKERVDHHASGESGLINIRAVHQTCQLDMITNTLFLSDIIDTGSVDYVLHQLVVCVSPCYFIKQIDYRVFVQKLQQ